MYDKYESPLSTRYASDYMLKLFSQRTRIETWRRLWTELAAAEHELGLPVTAEQVAALREHIRDIDFDLAAAREKAVRHDVMAHVYAYGKAAPAAAGIIHLGATSCYVTDNADLILYRDGLRYLRGELVKVLANLADFAEGEHRRARVGNVKRRLVEHRPRKSVVERLPADERVELARRRKRRAAADRRNLPRSGDWRVVE